MEQETLKLALNAEGIRAYYNDKQACDGQKHLLELLFGKEQLQPEKPKDVCERVKTFQDAVDELGSNNPLVKEYEGCKGAFFGGTLSPDLEAYFQLRIIVAALNEGWQPTFAEDEYRWYPWFVLYTKEEIEDMDEDDRRRVVGRAGSSASASGGLVCAGALNASSHSSAYGGARLAYCDEKRAAYAGKRFAEIYAQFIFGTSDVKRLEDETA